MNCSVLANHIRNRSPSGLLYVPGAFAAACVSHAPPEVLVPAQLRHPGADAGRRTRRASAGTEAALLPTCICMSTCLSLTRRQFFKQPVTIAEGLEFSCQHTDPALWEHFGAQDICGGAAWWGLVCLYIL